MEKNSRFANTNVKQNLQNRLQKIKIFYTALQIISSSIHNQIR
jgi:hypothetical protein